MNIKVVKFMNIEKSNAKYNLFVYLLVISGCFLSYWANGSPLVFLAIFFMSPFILASIFQITKYEIKYYLPILFGVVVLQMVILTYIYLFMPGYLQDRYFYIGILAFIVLVIIFSYLLFNRETLENFICYDFNGVFNKKRI